MEKSKICITGYSGGCWIVLGASYLLQKENESYMVKALFLICPAVSFELEGVPDNELKYWEVGNKHVITSGVELLATNYDL